MSDTVSPQKRSEIMKANKPKGNKSTELKLIQIFKEYNIKGWRRNYKIAKSLPDFVFLRSKTAVFVDGCFWHGHNCRNLTPKINSDYWQKKIEKNKIRDLEINKRLKKKGWKVLRIWECALKRQDNDLIEILNKIRL